MSSEERARRRRQAILGMRRRNRAFWESGGAAKMAARCRSIKQEAVSRLDELLPLAVRNLTENGFHVHLAGDAFEARNIAWQLIAGARIVCKAKTIVGREIELAPYLEERGVRIIETDLGDRLLQLAGGEASHQHHPSVHLSLPEIAALLGLDAPESGNYSPADLARFVASDLHQYMLAADWAIIGCNALAADPGAVFTVENEGNIRWLTTVVPNLLIVAGLDKIVADYMGAAYLCYATGCFAMGGKVTTYVDVIAGPSKSADIQMQFVVGVHGPSNVHVLLIDNGRRACLEAGLGEVLYCLNCSACLDNCPVYYARGEEFSAAHALVRGLIFTSFYRPLTSEEEERINWCRECGRCTEVCPVRIDTVTLLRKWRLGRQSEPIKIFKD